MGHRWTSIWDRPSCRSLSWQSVAWSRHPPTSYPQSMPISARPTGVVPTPSSALVTGYDFLWDAALAVQAELEAGLGSGISADTLLDLPTDSPSSDGAWTADQLSTALLDSRHDLIFLAGHFSAGGALAADYQTRLSAPEVDGSSVDLTNAIIFSAGCHSGYNIVNADGVPDVTEEPDWATGLCAQGRCLYRRHRLSIWRY